MKKELLLIVFVLAGIMLSFDTYSAEPSNALSIKKNADDPSIQDIQVSGTITDGTNGIALAGANITVKGTGISVKSDANGNFSINTPDEKSVLVISYVGYISQEIAVEGRTTLSVTLQQSTTDLTSVVVMGYGTQNKKDVTGAVKSVKKESFNRGIINAPEQLLQGKVAGVNVTSATGEPGGILGITVRGPGGVRTGSTPLFVVDGLALDNSSTGGGNPLNFLNPDDIEAIDVLKDASATAIYGSRGANGVILITTKRGRAGVSTLTISANLGVSNLVNPIEVFDASRFKAEVAKVGWYCDR